jgi:hypothetical protein
MAPLCVGPCIPVRTQVTVRRHNLDKDGWIESMISPHLQPTMQLPVSRCWPHFRSQAMHPFENLSLLRSSLFCALAFASSLVCAQPTGAPPAHGGQAQQQHRGPPPEALAACKALKGGQDCSFTSPHGAVKGSCFAPEGKPLACRPKDAPGQTPPQTPPAKK